MKRLILSVFYVFAIGISFAQVASDYYMPFCISNQTVLSAAGNSYGWTGRTLTYTIIKTDTINGVLYYVEAGTEYLFDDSYGPAVFNYSWLRADANGNIVLKAIDFSENPDPILDSALIFPSDMIILSNNYLTPGYSLAQTVFPGYTITDSVISTTAVWDVFSNCIHIRTTDIEDGDTSGVEDIFYAPGIGRVGGIRSLQVDDAHTKEFGTSFFTGCDPIVDSIPANVIDTCLDEYFDYYVNNIQVDSINHTLTVTWVFQDSTITNQFVQTYSYQYPGNNIIGITLQCSGKSSETYYKPVNINPSFHLDISENVNADLVSIFPNPASDNVVLSINGDVADGSSYRIFNATGFLVCSGDITKNQHHIINVSDFTNGLYFVEIFSANHIETQKLIIQK